MNLFKKKNVETVNKTTSDNTTKSFDIDNIVVEKMNLNYIIFSNSTSKYIIINNDFDNIFEFDSYDFFKNVILLKKNDMYALYMRNLKTLDKVEYEITDFIYSSFEIKDNLLILKSRDNTSIYYEGFILNNCIDIEEHKDLDIFIAKYKDHDELYTYLNKEILFIAKSITIEFLHKNYNAAIYRTSIIKYTRFNGTVGCYLLNHDTPLPFFNFMKDKDKELYLNSIDAVTLIENNYYIIAKDIENKSFLFLIKDIDNVSNKYNNIILENELFLCINNSKVEIIDCNFQVIYKELFEDVSNINLVYDKSKDLYTLTDNNNSIISIQLYHNNKYYKFINYFYSIYDFKETTSTLFNIDTGFFSDDFVKIIKNNVFELKDSYLIGYDNFFFVVTKDINLRKINEISYIINSEYLTNIIFKYKNLYHAFDKKYFKLLKNLDIQDLTELEIIDGKISFESYNKLADFKIQGDTIMLNIHDKLNLSFKVDDFKLALIKYYIDNN